MKEELKRLIEDQQDGHEGEPLPNEIILSEKRQITIRLPSGLIEKLKRKADVMGISLNSLIAAALNEYA